MNLLPSSDTSLAPSPAARRLGDILDVLVAIRMDAGRSADGVAASPDSATRTDDTKCDCCLPARSRRRKRYSTPFFGRTSSECDGSVASNHQVCATQDMAGSRSDAVLTTRSAAASTIYRKLDNCVPDGFVSRAAGRPGHLPLWYPSATARRQTCACSSAPEFANPVAGRKRSPSRSREGRALLPPICRSARSR